MNNDQKALARFTGDGGPADQAKINDVYGLAMDQHDNLYFVDSLNFAVRKINIPSKVITTVCGKGKPGEITEFERIDRCHLGGIAHPKGTTDANVPHGLDVNEEGYLFIADTGVNRIRSLTSLKIRSIRSPDQTKAVMIAAAGLP